MKKHQGSMQAVATLCLVLVLLTALGWIFWQNFIYKAPVVTNSSATTKPTVTTPANKTYTSGDVSFDYPSTGWKLATPENSSDNIKGVVTDTYKEDQGMGLVSGARIVLYVDHATSELKDPTGGATGISDVTEVTIAGHKAYTYRVDYEGVRLKADTQANGNSYQLELFVAGDTPTAAEKAAFDLAVKTLKI